MFAFLIFDCSFAHLLTTKHRPRRSVEEKFDLSACFDFSSAAWPGEQRRRFYDNPDRKI